jgi:hypothetical protein
MREEIKSVQAETISMVNAWIEDMKDDLRETMSCQVTTDACLHSKELNSEDMESEAEHREVPTEEAAVKSSGTMKKQHRGRHPAAGRRGELKELTRGDCGSRRKLVAACRKVPVVQQWHGARFRIIQTQGNSGPWKELPQPAGGCPTVQKWHSTGDMIARYMTTTM